MRRGKHLGIENSKELSEFGFRNAEGGFERENSREYGIELRG